MTPDFLAALIVAGTFSACVALFVLVWISLSPKLEAYLLRTLAARALARGDTQRVLSLWGQIAKLEGRA